MKKPVNQTRTQSKQQAENIPVPENRDNLDSRQHKEIDYKEKTNKEGRKSNSRDRDKHGA